jgi:putative addiction module killer protein
MIEVVRYQREDGREPFTEWLIRRRDRVAKARILYRIRQLQAGNLGDWKPVGGGIVELRVDVGAGYRVYCARHGVTLVILLCGGDKRTQHEDVKRAKAYLTDWEGRQR